MKHSAELVLAGAGAHSRLALAPLNGSAMTVMPAFLGCRAKRSSEFYETNTDVTGLMRRFDSAPSYSPENKSKSEWHDVSKTFIYLLTISESSRRWDRRIKRSRLRYVRSFSRNVAWFGQIFGLLDATI
jgi:hypothetical protein